MVGGGWKIALLLKQLKILQSLARPASKFLFEFPRRGSRRWEPLVSSAVSNKKKKWKRPANGKTTAPTPRPTSHPGGCARLVWVAGWQGG